MARPIAETSPAEPVHFQEEPFGVDGERSLPPRTPYEDALVGILHEVLGCTDVDVQDPLLTLGNVAQVPRVVAQIRRTFGVDIPVADYIESRTVAGLASVVAAKSFAARAATRPQALLPRPSGARPVLSFDQQRLWMENQLLPGVIYNVHGRRRVLGELDVAVLERSISAIIARHETLRTRFPATDGEPVQVVDDPDDDWHIRISDLTGLREQGGDASVEAAAWRLLDEELTTPFDLTTGPLIRCLLVKLGEREHALGVTMHHIVSDAWSIGMFIRELTTLYRAGGDPQRAGLSALPVQYRDYAVWQRGWLSGDALEHQVGHWRQHLQGAPRVLALPTVQRRTNALRAEAGQVVDALSPAETAALHELCRTHGVTSFMVLYAVLATIFSRWAGQTDVVIGVPVAGRTNSVTDRLIGFFVNMLPLRVDLSGDPDFAGLLQRVRRAALDGYAHAEAPMDELVRDLDIVRDPRRTPLFEVVLNVVASPEAEQVTDLAIEPMDTPSLFSRYDLTFTAQESGGVLRFKLDFPADRCDPETGKLLLRQLRTLLGRAVQDPTVRLLDEPAEPPVAAEPAYTLAPFDLRRPDGADLVAVGDGDGEWSYAWMSVAAERVAEVLAERGVRAGDRVGVVRRPNAAFVAGLLGAASAGAVGTVIETDDPALTGPLELTTVLDGSPAGTPAAGTVDLRTVLPAATDPLPAPNGGPAAQASDDWAVQRYEFGPGDRFVVLSSRPGHLMSAMRTAFGAGATLLVPDRAFGADAGALTTWLRENAVTVAYVDAPILRAMTAQTPVPDLPELRYVLMDNAGDLLPHDVEAVREMAPGCRCVAVYRVTADGRPLCCYEAPQDMEVRNAPLRVPLGTPLPGMPVTLRRASGQPAATGELAEIWYGDERTGDHGRRRADGSLEYAVVSSGGEYVDAAETLSGLRDVPGARDAVVLTQTDADGATTLVGYVAGPDPERGTAAIQSHLKARLPDYLVPRHLFVLDALPRTPWGEYDLRALPRPSGDAGIGDDYAAPRTPMERQLAELLAELLGIERVGIYDSFFELGGFSMLATRLITRVRDVFGVQLAVRDVFESPTVDELARLVVRAQGEQTGLDEFEALLDEVERA
ncbi:condensation domain-containing protein [Micromonospora profundi]|uniref:condensation domain-containing protein n=1 Tax=Micromonospora profundi TaxID=1420889 RepID=UPI003659DD25